MEQIEYIELVRQGDVNSFYNLISSHKTQMYKIAYSYFGNEQDALEAIQETTFRAYNSFHKLKQPQYFKTWLIRILINYCIDEKKRIRKSDLIFESTIIQAEEDIHSKIEIRRALQKLKPLSKSIIILKYFEDLTINEIAGILQRPEGTIKTWLNKALNELRIIIGEEDTPNV